MIQFKAMDAEIQMNILYRDQDYVVIDKPAGLLVHRSPLDASETVFVLQLLRKQIGQLVYPCHRLDRPTSGVLLFALNQDALRFTQNEFARQACAKTYRAVVRGWTEESGSINYDLRSEEEPEKVQSAFTEYRVLKQSELDESLGRYPTARFSYLELRPKTGRKHQLRRHLAHIRHPIIGDTRHGDGVQNRFFRKWCGSQMLMLRATELTFTHCKSEERINVTACDDSVFEAAVKKLELSPIRLLP
ncbi:MAG: pseudouridine synthase [Verrucomicrobiota bacterium]